MTWLRRHRTSPYKLRTSPAPVGTTIRWSMKRSACSRKRPYDEVRVCHSAISTFRESPVWATGRRLDVIVARMRELGVERVLYGSDGAVGGISPETALAAFRQLPLTPDEFRIIESNVAPYMR
jgi:predicted TIM-barrel fold metal-dependent hydrolase